MRDVFKRWLRHGVLAEGGQVTEHQFALILGNVWAVGCVLAPTASWYQLVFKLSMLIVAFGWFAKAYFARGME